MIIRIHKRTLALFTIFVLTFCFVPFLSSDMQAEPASAASVSDWGLSFQSPGKTPITDVPGSLLKKYDAYFVGNEEEKVLYLTFDAGYENGNTPKILDALKSTMPLPHSSLWEIT